jgi:Icc-related predicted phosphoesterase
MAKRILVISDLHFENEPHRGIDESKAFHWLKKIIAIEKPDILIGLGDWGHAGNLEDWQVLLQLVKVYSIYGNHENLELLKSLTNSDGTSVLQQDGQVQKVAGFKFGFINGVISNPPKVKEGVPRKSSAAFLEVAQSFVGVNVLCTHESPMLPEYEGKVTLTVGLQTARSTVEIVHPYLALSGHLSGSYTISKIVPTSVIRVDSSQQERHYVLIEPEKSLLRICNDHGTILECPISFILKK